MSAFQQPRSRFAALFASMLIVAPVSAGEIVNPCSSETYGRASGDVPIPGLGLVLELVGGHTAEPSLRLFGGVPGNSATIVISGDRAAAAGPNGTTVLVASAQMVAQGNFDWMGYFEAPIKGIADVAAGGRFHAQGIHTGPCGIDPARGTMLEMSNGLEFFRVDEQAPMTWADLLPRLPEHRLVEMEQAKGIEEMLRTALNSPGDEVVVKLQVDASVAVVAVVNVGGEVGLEAKVTRRDDGRYDVELGSDVAATAGVEACDGIEANAKRGVGGTRIFRFHSASGVARGLSGLAFALRFPDLQPARLLADHGVFDALKEQVEALRQIHLDAQQRVAEAEELLWTVAATRLAAAKARATAAAATYRSVKADFDQARFRTPAMYVALARSLAACVAAHAQHAVAHTALAAARAVVDAAQDLVAQVRERLAAALDAVARVGRIALVIAQTRTFAADHYAGFEIRCGSAAEVEATLGIPGLTLSNVGAGAEAGVSQKIKLRFEEETEHDPRLATITREFEQNLELVAGYCVGAEYEFKRTLALVDAFEIAAGGTRMIEHGAKLTTDHRLAGVVGAALAQKTGVGRTRELWIDQGELFQNLGNVFSLLTDDGLVAAAGGMGFSEVGLALQERFEDALVFEFGISYAGYGGGIEGSIEWSDRGEKRTASTTIRDAIETVLAKVD